MKSVIRTLVIDDERYSREELIHLLKQHPSIDIIGEGESGEQAIVLAMQLQPDVIFLDVEMPLMNGMEAAKALQELKNVPRIVFATAYPQFGVEAFRVDAVDYLLKPYDEEQLAETVSRLEKLFLKKEENRPVKSAGRLAVEVEGEILYVHPHDILYISREEKVSKIVTVDHEYEVKTTMKELEERLHEFPFFRIHKSYLVHMNYVLRLTPWFNGAYQLELKGRDEMLSVSRTYAKAFRAALEL
ncbi:MULTISPECIES: LytR/AlgR family response regulator transcription factor [unclassified Peribacillus]|uniref:LytR/AlgR family response regulator transcription factor n=1 Tax=unclassified Peribacillus TaxID=2675266 RepID=UPI0038209543